MSEPHAGRFDTPWLAPLYQVTGQVHGGPATSSKPLISKVLLRFRISNARIKMLLNSGFRIGALDSRTSARATSVDSMMGV